MSGYWKARKALRATKRQAVEDAIARLTKDAADLAEHRDRMLMTATFHGIAARAAEPHAAQVRDGYGPVTVVAAEDAAQSRSFEAEYRALAATLSALHRLAESTIAATSRKGGRR